MKDKILSAFNYLISIINKGQVRSVKAKKNILSSLIIRFASMVLSFLLLPLTIHYVNPTRYGIWITLSSIISWFGFFDIGFGNGLRNKFSEAIAKGKYKLARVYVSTTYAILIIIISVILIIFLCINPFLNWAKILNAPVEMLSELKLLALLVFVLFCFQFVFQLLSTIITANQQPAKASFINFIGSFSALAVIFILIKTTSGNLIYLALAFGLVPLLVLIICSIWYYTHQYKIYAPSIKFVRFRFAKGLMSLGLKFFIIQIAFVILFQTDNIIIAHLFGPKEVTPYNVAFKYFSVIPMFFGIIITPFWSAFTEAWFTQDIGWIKNTIKRLKQFWGMLCILTIIMLCISGFIFRIWIGKEVTVPLSLCAIIAVYIMINAWNGIYSHFINGVGKIKLQLYASIIGMLLNIPMAIFLGKLIGVGGVILASVILGSINMVWIYIQYNKIINNKATGIWAK